MPNLNEKATLTFKQLFPELARGGVVGAWTITAVTPLMNYMNYCNDGVIVKSSGIITQFTLRRAFD